MPIRLPTNPPLVEVPVTQVLWRVHPAAFGPVWFGPAPGDPPKGRFDAPCGEFGICYFSAALGVAILETAVRGRRIALVTPDALRDRSASSLAIKAPLTMLHLEGKGLASFGIDAATVSRGDYRACQDLAQRTHAQLDTVDGIQYRSRWDTSELCWAVFDRAVHKLGDVLGTQPLDNPAVARPALVPYRHEWFS
jgi:hypothetical protein